MARSFPLPDGLTTAVRTLTLEFCTTYSAHSFSRRLQDSGLSAHDTSVIAAALGSYFLDHQNLELLDKSLRAASVGDARVTAVVDGVSKAIRELSSLDESD